MNVDEVRRRALFFNSQNPCSCLYGKWTVIKSRELNIKVWRSGTPFMQRIVTSLLDEGFENDYFFSHFCYIWNWVIKILNILFLNASKWKLNFLESEKDHLDPEYIGNTCLSLAIAHNYLLFIMMHLFHSFIKLVFIERLLYTRNCVGYCT